MARIDSAFFEIGSLDTFAVLDTPLHRLDPRAKVMTTLVFILCVVSFEKYQLSALLPFFIFPLVLVGRGRLPAIFLLKKLLLVAPFAFFVGVFNPLFDHEVLFYLGSVGVSGGWVSFASILLRFALTVSATLILIATTGFTGVCMALEKIGAPRVFTIQLLFLYRYLFVLIDEAQRLVRARALRTFRGRGTGMTVFGQIVGQLLLRTIDRAQRIHLAMRCRGFTGEIRQLRKIHFGQAELLFTLGWSGLFIALRWWNLPEMLGAFLLELAR